MAQIKVTVSTRFINSGDSTIVDVPDEELEDLNELERAKVFDEYGQEALWSLIDWGWEEVS